VGINGGANGDGSSSGGDGILGTIAGSGMASGFDDRGFGIVIMVPPPAPEGPGGGMNMGDGDLFLIIPLRPLRSF